MDAPYRYIRFFRDIGIGDVPLVGGKNAALGEMYRSLTPQGIRVPNGFAITAEAYRYVLAQAHGVEALHAVLDGLDANDADDLAARGARAREIVYRAALPTDLRDEILRAYRQLREEYGEDLSVAVRSSATAEDLPTASFAGQQETYLNVSGEERLLDACRRCFASLFTDRALHYRVDQHFDHFRVALSIGVMKMVRSDLACSGIMFSLDTDSGFRDVVLISASYGLGENIVQGIVDPDDFLVFKPTLASGFRQVLRRELGSKKLKLVYGPSTDAGAGTVTTANVETSAQERARYCLSDAEVVALAEQAVLIERHFSARSGHPTPMDMEWAKDGLDHQLYLVQARPETVASQKALGTVEEYHLKGSGPVRLSGLAIGSRIGGGHAHVIGSPHQMAAFRDGEVLVTDNTTPDWEPVMKRAAAVVTNRGGRTCHAAIVARELGIPAIVGTGNATEVLRTGEPLTVDCSAGETGHVHAGLIPFEVEQLDLRDLPRTHTELMLILGNPELAFQSSFLPCDGVGLARMEFIVTEYVKAHPMALLHPERVTDAAERASLAQLTQGYAQQADFFVERLSEGIGMLAAAFYPKPVILRLSDFKTNEYASLLGGRGFEPVEDNPMLGFRGASRYSHPAYREGFGLECAAIRRVREQMGLTNLKIMVPFCRRVAEAERTLATLQEFGLVRGLNGLEVYVMCEIPNNVLQIDAFSRYFDGFSIGSNDLTQLTLGVDRDSELVAFEFDERDEGVKMLLQLAVEGCRRNGRHSGICGQAPSDYPEIAEFLVRLGIDSISLNPDRLVATLRRVAALEQATPAVRAPVAAQAAKTAVAS
ncbi:MAG TPA: phosphoenolpyruvate synthase [Steroidobacteraceae bacterium]|nr:phosphoenolpyruvate synthase [Steroidobacteraceae bacterium]